MGWFRTEKTGNVIRLQANAGELAHRYDFDIYPDDEVVVAQHTNALFFLGGAYLAPLKPGQRKVRDLGDEFGSVKKGAAVRIIVINRGDVPVSARLTGFSSKDGRAVEVDFLLNLAVSDPGSFYNQRIKENEVVLEADIWAECKSDFRDALKEIVNKKSTTEFYENLSELKLKTGLILDEKLNGPTKTLGRYGLAIELLRAINFIVPDEEELRKEKVELKLRGDRAVLNKLKIELDEQNKEALLSEKIKDLKRQGKLEEAAVELALSKMGFQTDLNNKEAELEYLSKQKNISHLIDLEKMRREYEELKVRTEVLLRGIRVDADIEEGNKRIGAAINAKKIAGELENALKRGSLEALKDISIETMLNSDLPKDQKDVFLRVLEMQNKIKELQIKSGLTTEQIRALDGKNPDEQGRYAEQLQDFKALNRELLDLVKNISMAGHPVASPECPYCHNPVAANQLSCPHEGCRKYFGPSGGRKK